MSNNNDTKDDFLEWLWISIKTFNLIKIWPIVTSLLSVLISVFKSHGQLTPALASKIIFGLNISLLFFIIIKMWFRFHSNGDINRIKNEDNFDNKFGTLKKLGYEPKEYGKKKIDEDYKYSFEYYAERASILIQQFRWSLLSFWVSMLLTYIVLLFQTKFVATDTSFIILDYFSILFNNIGWVSVTACFLVIYKQTLDDEHNKSILWKKLIWFIIILNIMTICHLAWFNISSLVSMDNLKDINTSAKIISGLLNAVTMTLLFGRFESKRLNSPTWLLIVLYIYAVAQALYGFFETPLFGDSKIIVDLAIIFCLIGKSFFFLYVLWICETPRLFYYFLVTPKANRKIDKEWNDVSKMLESE